MISTFFRGTFVWAAFTIYTGLVFWFAVQPGAKLHPFFGQHDKSLHALEFGVLFLLAVSAFYRSTLRSLRPLWRWAMSYALVVGVATELLQTAIPGRQASWLDLAADFSGAGLMMGILWSCRDRLPPETF